MLALSTVMAHRKREEPDVVCSSSESQEPPLPLEGAPVAPGQPGSSGRERHVSAWDAMLHMVAVALTALLLSHVSVLEGGKRRKLTLCHGADQTGDLCDAENIEHLVDQVLTENDG